MILAKQYHVRFNRDIATRPCSSNLNHPPLLYMPSNREHGALEVTNLSPVKTRKITVAIAWDNLPTRLEIPALSTTTTTTPKM